MTVDRGARWRWAVRLIAATVAALATGLLLAWPASAHAALIDTDPDDGAVLSQAPAEVGLSFNEPVRLPAGGIQLFDATGRDLAASSNGEGDKVRVQLPSGMPDGSYQISWRVVSADGHPLSGSFSFSIGSPSETVVAAAPAAADPAQGTDRLRSVSQGIHYVALLLATGLLAFSLLLPRTAPAVIRRRLARIIGGAAIVAVLTGLALVPVSGAVKLGGSLATLGSFAAWDPDLVGTEWLTALLVAAGLGTLVATYARAHRAGRGWYALPVIGATVALVAPSLVGHTRSFSPSALLMLTDLAHLAAGAVWIGGLVGLAVTLPALSTRRGLAAQVLTRFSTAAAASLAVLVVMGSVLSWRILSSWDLLFHTTYGVLLLVKIGIVAAAVLVAMGNRFILLPRVRRSASDRPTGPSGPGAARLLRRAIGLEALMLTAALVLTGFLSSQSPHPATPASAASVSLSQAQVVGDFRVVATMLSSQVGANTLEIETQTLAGEPSPTPAPPALSITSGTVDLGTVDLTRTGPGTYQAPVVLPESGVWDVQVSLRLSRFESPVVSLPFEVAE